MRFGRLGWMTALVAVTSACELAESPSADACDAGGVDPIVITVEAACTGDNNDGCEPGEPVAEDYVVRGHVEGPNGERPHVAVRSVVVAGIRARSDAFNFSSWSVTVPLATLRALAGDPEDDANLWLTAVAEHACGGQASERFLVPVAGRVRNVEGLSVTVDDGTHQYLPADGSSEARVVVRAANGAGSRVVLRTTRGQLASATEAGSQITLVLAERTGDMGTIIGAEARLVALGDEAGQATVSVIAPDSALGTEHTDVTRFVAAPEFSPESATLAPGGAIRLRVTTRGGLSRCSAAGSSPEPRATIDGIDLSDPLEISGDSLTERLVEVSAGAPTSPAEITIECRDDYEQVGRAVVRVEP